MHSARGGLFNIRVLEKATSSHHFARFPHQVLQKKHQDLKPPPHAETCRSSLPLRSPHPHPRRPKVGQSDSGVLYLEVQGRLITPTITVFISPRSPPSRLQVDLELGL